MGWNRRAFMLSCGALLAPRSSVAQRVHRIAYLSISRPQLDRDWLRAFHDELVRLGYVEGRDLQTYERHADGYVDRFSQFVAEARALKAEVLVVYGAWHIADKLRGATPVVMTVVPDPVAQGLVTNLARPGGNITGFSDLHGDLVAKRLQLLREIAPGATRIAVLHYPSDMALLQVKGARVAAPSLAMTLVPLTVDGPRVEDVDRAFAALDREGAEAMLVIAEPTVAANRSRIAELAVSRRLPTMSTVREFAQAGFLISYGADFRDLWRRSAIYVDKILRGTHPGDLPIEQPTKFDLVINKGTAARIGLKIPSGLLARADHVIP